jgi:hypothetical protein
VSVKLARILPVLGGAVGFALLRMVGEDATMTYSTFQFFLGLHAPVVPLRLLPPIFHSPTGIFLGCLASDLNVVIGSLGLWFFVGRWIDGDHRWPQALAPSIALGFFLLGMGGMLAYWGIEGSRIGEGRDWLPWYFTAMVLTWMAVFLYAAWRLFLDLRKRSFEGVLGRQ